MSFGKILTLLGSLLLATALVSATFIPSRARQDSLATKPGQIVFSEPGFSTAYKQMGAQRRLLQNFYVGAAGLVFLAIGLARWSREVPIGSGTRRLPDAAPQSTVNASNSTGSVPL